MLPIVYALMAESVPSGPRGWLVVLHGGMGTVGARCRGGVRGAARTGVLVAGALADEPADRRS
jgi:hypothetical protein